MTLTCKNFIVFFSVKHMSICFLLNNIIKRTFDERTHKTLWLGQVKKIRVTSCPCWHVILRGWHPPWWDCASPGGQTRTSWSLQGCVPSQGDNPMTYTASLVAMLCLPAWSGPRTCLLAPVATVYIIQSPAPQSFSRSAREQSPSLLQLQIPSPRLHFACPSL